MLATVYSILVKEQHSRHGHASFGQPARTYTYQLCMDTICSLEDQPGSIENRNEWEERDRELCTISSVWTLYAV